MPKLAPIALFAYKRPDHLARTLRSLRQNPEAAASELFLFCDGARSPADQQAVNEVRKVAREVDWCAKLTVRERHENAGLSRSIMEGVSELCEQYGKVIVLEDDLELSPHFLSFLNEGLRRYETDDRVYQVTGYNYPTAPHAEADAFFLVHSSCWGWGTWRRAWQSLDKTPSLLPELEKNRALQRRFDMEGAYPYTELLRKQARGEVDSWGILWYQTLFRQDGLSLMPKHTLVHNRGSDGSGTHGWGIGYQDQLSDFQVREFPREIAHSPAAYQAISAYLYRERNSLAKKLNRRLRLWWQRWAKQ